MSRGAPMTPQQYAPTHPAPMYYGHPGVQHHPSGNPMQPPPPPHYAHPEAGMYQYARDAMIPPGSRVNGWGSAEHAGYANATAGPSRGTDPTEYAPSYRTSPPGSAPRTAGAVPLGGPPGAGWSSIHPATAPPTSAARSGQVRRGSVKLEDLVSHDRTRPTSSKAVTQTNGPAGLTSTPLNESHSSDGQRANAAVAQEAPGSGTGGGGQSGPSEFIKKLYRMLEEEHATFGKVRASGKNKRGPVGWSRGGTTFVVWDMNDFTTKILPQTFRHSNFSSFVRQLNKYGFSKIKHVDDDTGQIKENIWEFQHPSFQTGGQSDLESIKRKTVAPKKSNTTAETGDEPSPGRTGPTSDDLPRMAEMESRVTGLEDQLAKALDEIHHAKSREAGLMNVVREMIGQLASMEQTPAGSPAKEPQPSARIVNLYRQLEAVASSPASAFTPNYAMQHRSSFSRGTGYPIDPHATSHHPSPMTDAGSRASDGPSPVPSRASISRRRASRAKAVAEQAEEMSENPATTTTNMPAMVPAPNSALPAASSSQPVQSGVKEDGSATLYNGEPVEMTPIFAEVPAWLTDNTPLPPYHRKSSDANAIRMMVEALSGGQGDPNVPTLDGTQVDPMSQPVPGIPANHPSGQDPAIAVQAMAAAVPTPAPVAEVKTNGINGSNGVNSVNGVPPQLSPFRNLGFPVQGPAPVPSAAKGSPEGSKEDAVVRRSGLKPHWTHSPRILVVEDDVVYRQLSSKFLEKFGCVTETVDDAQGAIQKISQTKYDLVLMDIFFGPSMDGRKATSLIRQFDMYTPIISMTSNVQTQDVTSYLQSGMNDVLAKPFTKNGLFNVLDKHLIHLKAIQLSAEIPRAIGVPPLSDQGVQDALATGASQWVIQNNGMIRNPLAGMGWSDDTYQLVLSQFMATGNMPEVTAITNGTIGTSVVFGDSASFHRKRSIETLDEDIWSPAASTIPNGSIDANIPGGIPGMSMNINGTVGTAGTAGTVLEMPMVPGAALGMVDPAVVSNVPATMAPIVQTTVPAKQTGKATKRAKKNQ